MCDRFDSSEAGGENNNNKDIANHNRDLQSEDGDDKSEEGELSNDGVDILESRHGTVLIAAVLCSASHITHHTLNTKNN